MHGKFYICMCIMPSIMQAARNNEFDVRAAPQVVFQHVPSSLAPPAALLAALRPLARHVRELQVRWHNAPFFVFIACSFNLDYAALCLRCI